MLTYFNTHLGNKVVLQVTVGAGGVVGAPVGVHGLAEAVLPAPGAQAGVMVSWSDM